LTAAATNPAAEPSIHVFGRLAPGFSERHAAAELTTVGDQLARTTEANRIGRSLDLDGKSVRLAFVQRLRDERKFPDLEALQDQIAADVRRAARLFDRLSV